MTKRSEMSPADRLRVGITVIAVVSGILVLMILFVAANASKIKAENAATRATMTSATPKAK